MIYFTVWANEFLGSRAWQNEILAKKYSPFHDNRDVILSRSLADLFLLRKKMKGPCSGLVRRFRRWGRINRETVIKGRKRSGRGRKKVGKLWESWKVYPADSGQLLRPGQRQFYVTEGAIYWHDYDRHTYRWRHNPALSYGQVYVLTREQTGLYKNTLRLS